MPSRCLLVFLAAAALAPAQQYRAFWADAFHYGFKSTSEIDRMVDEVAQARGNAIFIQVRRRADSYYLQTREVPAQDAAYAPGFDALAYLIDKAHARGIEVHAWFVVYPVWPSTIAPPLNPDHVWHKHGPRATGDDMWMQVNAQGQILSAFDPGHPGAQSYLAGVITDPLERYEIDGIHLDYIRYDEAGNYGGNPKSLERFQRQELRAARPAANDAAWADFRRRQVSGLVRQIYLRSLAIKPRVKVSAALISWGNGPLNDAGFRGTDAFATVFQDWRSWLEEGILDLAMPMHYFRESSNAAFLDRWTEFAKTRQYRRAYLPGLAPYLNPIAASLEQARRALAQSPFGVTFYSYASTNTLDSAGLPIVPNSEFYRQTGEFFGADAKPPVLDWKVNPQFGHAMGNLEIPDSAPSWLADGVTLTISSDTGKDFARTGASDGTGFFGFVDLPPDRYALELERGGRLVMRATPQDVKAGEVTRFALQVPVDAFAAVLPRLTRLPDRASPGEIVTLEGVNLAPGQSASAETYAPGVPLPVTLAGAQVSINGVAAAPLFSVAANRIVLQMPYLEAESWTVVLRQGGMESAPVRLAWAKAAPKILGVNKRDGYLEIYATGLGLVDTPIEAGRGADPGGLPRVPGAVAILDGVETAPAFAGLAPYQPGIYQVNVELSAGSRASGSIRIAVADEISNAVMY